MKFASVAVTLLVAAMCASPVPLSAGIDLAASRGETVGSPVQLVVKVANTGPLIPHLGLVFRTADRWYQTHHLTDMGGCTVAPDDAAFDCGDLAAGAAQTFTISGLATVAGSFHYELALRELVQPFDYVDDHPDGPDIQAWDETVAPAA